MARIFLTNIRIITITRVPFDTLPPTINAFSLILFLPLVFSFHPLTFYYHPPITFSTVLTPLFFFPMPLLLSINPFFFLSIFFLFFFLLLSFKVNRRVIFFPQELAHLLEDFIFEFFKLLEFHSLKSYGKDCPNIYICSNCSRFFYLILEIVFFLYFHHYSLNQMKAISSQSLRRFALLAILLITKIAFIKIQSLRS